MRNQKHMAVHYLSFSLGLTMLVLSACNNDPHGFRPRDFSAHLGRSTSVDHSTDSLDKKTNAQTQADAQTRQDLAKVFGGVAGNNEADIHRLDDFVGSLGEDADKVILGLTVTKTGAKIDRSSQTASFGLEVLALIKLNDKNPVKVVSTGSIDGKSAKSSVQLTSFTGDDNDRKPINEIKVSASCMDGACTKVLVFYEVTTGTGDDQKTTRAGYAYADDSQSLNGQMKVVGKTIAGEVKSFNDAQSAGFQAEDPSKETDKESQDKTSAGGDKAEVKTEGSPTQPAVQSDSSLGAGSSEQSGSAQKPEGSQSSSVQTKDQQQGQAAPAAATTTTKSGAPGSAFAASRAQRANPALGAAAPSQVQGQTTVSAEAAQTSKSKDYIIGTKQSESAASAQAIRPVRGAQLIGSQQSAGSSMDSYMSARNNHATSTAGRTATVARGTVAKASTRVSWSTQAGKATDTTKNKPVAKAYDGEKMKTASEKLKNGLTWLGNRIAGKDQADKKQKQVASDSSN